MGRIAASGNKNTKLIFSDISSIILKCCHEIRSELGYGFLEKVYKNALYYSLNQKGLKVFVERVYEIYYQEHRVGTYIADIVVENKIILELKCCKSLLPEHQAQLINYLKAADLPIGLLINFGNPKLEYKRLMHPELHSSLVRT